MIAPGYVPSRRGLRGVIDRLCYVFEYSKTNGRPMTLGDIAEVRRNLSVDTDVYARLIEDVPLRWCTRDTEIAWTTIFHCIADNGLSHCPWKPIGTELRAIDFSETRLQSILRARDQVQLVNMRQLVQILVSRNREFDMAEIAEVLLVHEETYDHTHMTIREKISADFYRRWI